VATVFLLDGRGCARRAVSRRRRSAVLPLLPATDRRRATRRALPGLRPLASRNGQRATLLDCDGVLRPLPLPRTPGRQRVRSVSQRACRRPRSLLREQARGDKPSSPRGLARYVGRVAGAPPDTVRRQGRHHGHSNTQAASSWRCGGSMPLSLSFSRTPSPGCPVPHAWPARTPGAKAGTDSSTPRAQSRPVDCRTPKLSHDGTRRQAGALQRGKALSESLHVKGGAKGKAASSRSTPKREQRCEPSNVMTCK